MRFRAVRARFSSNLATRRSVLSLSLALWVFGALAPSVALGQAERAERAAPANTDDVASASAARAEAADAEARTRADEAAFERARADHLRARGRAREACRAARRVQSGDPTHRSRTRRCTIRREAAERAAQALRVARQPIYVARREASLARRARYWTAGGPREAWIAAGYRAQIWWPRIRAFPPALNAAARISTRALGVEAGLAFTRTATVGFSVLGGFTAGDAGIRTGSGGLVLLGTPDTGERVFLSERNSVGLALGAHLGAGLRLRLGARGLMRFDALVALQHHGASSGAGAGGRAAWAPVSVAGLVRVSPSLWLDRRGAWSLGPSFAAGYRALQAEVGLTWRGRRVE